MRKSKNRYFYHILVSPGDAPGAITLNVIWMEREFDAYKLPRWMCPSNYNRFSARARYWSQLISVWNSERKKLLLKSDSICSNEKESSFFLTYSVVLVLSCSEPFLYRSCYRCEVRFVIFLINECWIGPCDYAMLPSSWCSEWRHTRWTNQRWAAYAFSRPWTLMSCWSRRGQWRRRAELSTPVAVLVVDRRCSLHSGTACKTLPTECPIKRRRREV